MIGAEGTAGKDCRARHSMHRGFSGEEVHEAGGEGVHRQGRGQSSRVAFMCIHIQYLHMYVNICIHIIHTYTYIHTCLYIHIRPFIHPSIHPYIHTFM